MRKTWRWQWQWIFLCILLLIIQSHLGWAIGATTISPPEGNTTFVEGVTWCVAAVGVSQADLQNALDWACGPGQADCRPIKNGGPCYRPNNLLSHASYAFNSYYQQNGNSDVACNFGGTAIITKHDPGYGKCSFAASEQTSVASALFVAYTWRLASILFLLQFGS